MDISAILVAWVGALAFVLAIPMSISANLLTPKIQHRWAMTTAIRKARRIQELEDTLTRYNSRPAHWADILYKFVRTGFILLCAVSVCLGAFLSELHAHLHRIEYALHIRPLPPDLPWDNRQFLKLLIIAASFVSGSAASFLVIQVRHLSPQYLQHQKESVLHELERLMAKRTLS